MGLLGGVRRETGLPGDGVIGRNGWDADAFSARLIRPAVIGADEGLPLHPAEGERSPPVDAEALIGPHLTGNPADDDLLVQQLDGQGLVRRLFRPADRAPILPQNRPQGGFVQVGPPESGLLK